MKNIFLFLVWIVALHIYSGSAIAETYECDAVDKKATVYSKSSVSIEHDKNAKTCTFSVAGATSRTAAKNFSDQLEMLMNEFYNDWGGRRNLFHQTDTAIHFVTKLMGAANTFGQLPEVALKKFNERDAKNVLSKCFETAAYGGTFSDGTRWNQIKCSVEYADSSTERSYRILSIEVESDSMKWSLHYPLP